jgi:hypothetical protein
MLFDLRGRGRRRTIQVIYLFLAVLIGGGLVFFGVGGTGVGLFNNDNNQGPSSSISNDALKNAEKQVKTQPQNAVAWANLARRRFQSADYDQNQKIFTNQTQLRQVSAAYLRYRTLLGAKKAPDASLLQQMITVYGETGLADFANAAKVADDLSAAQPKNITAFEQLAIYAKVAGQSRQADLAQQKAISLADGKQAAKQIKQVIKQQTQLIQAAQQQAAGAASGASSGG